MQLSDILTIEGVAGAAALITVLIQVLKTTFKVLDNGYEKPLALGISAVLVVLAAIDAGNFSLQTGFTDFVAWLSIAKLSTGIYDEVSGQPGSFRGGDSPEVDDTLPA